MKARRGLVFVLVIAALAANAVVSYRAARALQANYQSVSHTYEVLAVIQQIEPALVDAETSQRGYIITGEDRYLEPYVRAVRSAEDGIAKFESLTQDNPHQQRRVPELRVLVQRRVASLARGIAVRRSGAPEEARKFILSGQGKTDMDAVHKFLPLLAQEERRLLALRDRAADASARSLYLTVSIASLLAVLFVILAWMFSERDQSTRELARRALQESHDELESRVQERTHELGLANEELGRSNRELQDFAFVASHDLQEPLRKIQAFGDLLKNEYAGGLGADGADFIDRMQSAARRMNALIRELLEYSRVVTRGQTFVPVDLSVVVREVLEDLQTRVAEAKGRVTVGDLPTIDADALQMRQLMQNLIGNALKFRRPEVPPAVTVTSSIETPSDGTRVLRLRVTDNGIGFDPKYLDRIFTPFQRLHGGRDYEGTGMGLAVCRRIAERHGGQITATSVPGEGSEFLVTIPATHPESHPSEGNTTGGERR